MVESYKGGNRAFSLSNTRHSAQDDQSQTPVQITKNTNQATFGPDVLFPR